MHSHLVHLEWVPPDTEAAWVHMHHCRLRYGSCVSLGVNFARIASTVNIGSLEGRMAVLHPLRQIQSWPPNYAPNRI